MKNFIDYFFGTIAVIMFAIALIFIASLGASGIVFGFLLLPVYMQIPCVCVVILGEVILIAITICSVCNNKEYTRIIREIDKNPSSPKATEQVLSYKYRSVVQDIIN